jgi:hypothetical protein
MYRLLAGLLVAASLTACRDDDDTGSGGTVRATVAPMETMVAVSAPGVPASTKPVTAVSQFPTQAPRAATEPPQTGGRTDIHVPLAAGSSGEVQSNNPDPSAATEDEGTVKVTLVSITDPATPESGSIFTPSSGTRWYVIEVTMENTSDKVANTGVWTVLTDDGQEYENQIVANYGGLGNDITYGPIQPGNTAEGVVLFEIPETAAVQSVKVSPSIYVGGDLYFDAQ